MSATRALVAHGVDDLRLETVALREPVADEAVVEIAYGGVCGSDLHYWTDGASGTSILREPMVLGHEVVGRVAVAATDGSGPPAGTPVAVHPNTPLAGDGSRYPADSPNLAPGASYLGSAAHLPHTDGAFADRVVLRTAMLRPLPAGLDLRLAALVEPASVAWHAVSRAGEISGRRVAVIGCGPIGLLAVGVLRRAGAAHITATDLHDLPLDLARRLGADATVDVSGADAVAAIAAIDADVVIEASGSKPGLASAFEATTRGGTVIMVGMPRTGFQEALLALAVVRELDVRGAFRFNAEIDDVITALADGSLAVEPVITHVVDAADALAGFATALDASTSSKVLLRFAAAT